MTLFARAAATHAPIGGPAAETEPVIRRSHFSSMKRIVVKLGTSVVTNQEGLAAVGRMGNVVEQVTELVKRGHQVILVSSGSIGLGRQRLQREKVLSMSLRKYVAPGDTEELNERACAAAGQSGLMHLYSTMFGECRVSCSQILVTDSDFSSRHRRKNLRSTIDALLEIGVVPIINENDVVSTREEPTTDKDGHIFWDNDSLASLVGAECGADLIILLSDVKGLYDAPPTEAHAKIIHTYSRKSTYSIGTKSRVGRGGMQAKVDAAMNTIDRGVKAVVIASGFQKDVVSDIMSGKTIGTLFVKNPHVDQMDVSAEQAIKARDASRNLATLDAQVRCDILLALADGLISHEADIMKANRLDLKNAEASTMSGVLKSRLKLSPEKLRTLADGIRSIAKSDPLGKVLRHTEVAADLDLVQLTVPIGVLLIIFESRPDALVQIAALSISSGNGLLLKGGKEAQRSNAVLHQLVCESIEKGSQGKISPHLVALVNSRHEVDSLLNLDEYIDLVIPRGSNELVSHIQRNTKIPVLGHAEGICHVYVDEFADLDKAVRVIIDAKTDYPTACNAVETILLHRTVLDDGRADKIVAALRAAGVVLYGDSTVHRKYHIPAAQSMRHEYSDLCVTLVAVSDVRDAVEHIHEYGSGHTDSIITENQEHADLFLKSVCVTLALFFFFFFFFF